MSNISFEYWGNYRILNLISSGQSSRIYQAYDDQNRQAVCIKTLLDKTAKDKEQIQILKQEYDIAKRLNHPKLIRVFSFGWQRDVPYIVMEWFAGSNLKSLINRGYSQYCDQIEQIVFNMIDSLSHLHLSGWVHRDIKPDNFLFDTKNKELKLIDFAITRKNVTGFSRFFTRRSQPQGTGSYMPPEQIKGLPPEFSADIYSLGCTIYELLTMRLPFSGDSMNDLLKKHLSAPMPNVISRNKNITKEFNNLLKTITSKSAKDRPNNATELLRIIQKTKIFQNPPKPEDIV
ncbi:MAG: serine/threonine protein kinase [Planctomycetaceae bacterium]|jgi:serine/threonine protein kinase|nr:serine/threonine protein kinase [Planctomycetaceae bacterium]